MFGNKNTAGLWRFLPVVSCAAALLSVCVCAYVVFGAKHGAKTSALQLAQQQQQGTAATDAVPKNAAQAPQFRLFNGGLEVLQNGIWVPMEALDQMQQSDPLFVALQAYMEKNGLTPSGGESSGRSNEASAPGGQKPLLGGTVPEKRDSRRSTSPEEPVETPAPVVTPPPNDYGGGPLDTGVEESGAYL